MKDVCLAAQSESEVGPTLSEWAMDYAEAGLVAEPLLVWFYTVDKGRFLMHTTTTINHNSGTVVGLNNWQTVSIAAVTQSRTRIT